MPKRSAGLLLHRPVGAGSGAGAETEREVLLVHPGGPLWVRKDLGSWSVPKGEYGPDEAPEAAARREFAEELGLAVPAGELLPLGEVKQAGGKVVTCFALAADLDLKGFVSNEFSMQWPPGSGRQRMFPEVDQAEWFALDEARRRLLAGQLPFLDRLVEALATS
jgi:predicted NUDIX family NTP pyrophosphohydrolase